MLVHNFSECFSDSIFRSARPSVTKCCKMMHNTKPKCGAEDCLGIFKVKVTVRTRRSIAGDLELNIKNQLISIGANG